MKAQSFFEQNGGTYMQVGDVVIPDLTVEETKPIGRWGRMRRHYLKEHRPVLYINLLVTGELFTHLYEIDEVSKERMELLTHQMAKREDATEALKAADQMEWVRRMNSIRNRAEEMIMRELIYTEEAQDADT